MWKEGKGKKEDALGLFLFRRLLFLALGWLAIVIAIPTPAPALSGWSCTGWPVRA